MTTVKSVKSFLTRKGVRITDSGIVHWKELREKVQLKSGVYVLYGRGQKKIKYVGRSKNLLKRAHAHEDGWGVDHGDCPYVYIAWFCTRSSAKAECMLYLKYKPPCNKVAPKGCK